MNIIDETSCMLNSRDILDIQKTYYGVNPIYNSYVLIKEKWLQKLDEVSFKMYNESDAVSFYVIMKIIDKALELSKVRSSDDSPFLRIFLLQVPVFLFDNYKQIFGCSYEYNRVGLSRVLAVCETIFLCLDTVRKTSGINGVLLDSFRFNEDFRKKYHIDDVYSILSLSENVRYSVESRMWKEIKKYMKSYRKKEPKNQISQVIDKKSKELAQANIKHSNIYIKKGKKTGVVLAIVGMAKAGWLVDAMGKEIKSVGSAIELILDVVFNDKKCKNARQILSHAKNVNKKEISSYFQELIDSLLGNK